VTARFRAVYGEGPLHLAGHLAVIGMIGYVVVQLADARSALTILLWVVGAAVLHDLLLVPAYAAVDRIVRTAIPRFGIPAVNHVRFVLVVSGSLALVWLPSMLGKADDNIVRNAGQEPGDYLTPWLLVTGGLAALSAAAYGLRVLRAHRVDQLDDPVGPAADEDAPRA